MHVVGLSVLSGSHLQVVPAVLRGPARRPGWTTSPWWSAASFRTPTPARLREQGVARVFTPKDFAMTDIMGQIVDVDPRGPRPRREGPRRHLEPAQAGVPIRTRSMRGENSTLTGCPVDRGRPAAESRAVSQRTSSAVDSSHGPCSTAV